MALLVVVAMLLASALTAYAIGFVAEDVYESVFVVYSANSLGSGFAIGKNCILTNAHVIENPNDIVIKTYSGKEYTADLLGINSAQDIAVLGVAGVEFEYLTVTSSAAMKTGDDIYAIGAPKSMAYTLTKGVVSAKNREIAGNEYIQIDAPINEGNSGGPLLNDSGQVVGINTLKMTDSEGIGLAIPMEVVKNYLNSLGIELNESGNVVGSVKATPSKPTEITEAPAQSDSTENKSKQPPTIVFLLVCIIAFVSICCNVSLAVALIHQKKRNVIYKYDPRERTDFEIDILG
jgi:serine protease Do